MDLENAIEQTITLQNKAIRLISFVDYRETSSPLYKNLGMLKLLDIITQSNVLFTHNTINSKSPDIFNKFFIFSERNHEHETVNSLNSNYSIPTGSLNLPDCQTNAGRSSVQYICCNTWNSILKDLSLSNIDKYEKDPFWINNTSIIKIKKY